MKRTLEAAAVAIAWGAFAAAAHAAPAGHPTPTIHARVDAAQRAVLAGNTRPEATAANDLGAVADEQPLGHMFLLLKRSPEREAALRQYIEELHDPQSSNYHQWLTAAQFAEHFGVAQEDVAAVTQWLESEGFTVHGVTPTGLLVDFSGTAGQVRAAFHAEMHRFRVKGARHIANAGDPSIPAALAPAVLGVVSLHDFHPTPHFLRRAAKPAYTYSTTNGTFHGLVPGDIATIYDLAPLFAAGISGQGQTIMVLEDTYLYSTSDWTVFRKTFGLARPYPHGTLSQLSPTGAVTCTNPGFQGVASDPGYGDDGEAAIDVEWATATAPNAAIVLAACTDGASITTFGGLIALENVLNGPAAGLPSVVSMSYGESEALDGAAANAAFNNAYQQAVAEGVSIFVSAGDEDASSSSLGSAARYGIGISGFASTPYNVAVGGTDFGYTANFVDPSTYWSSANSSTYSSALSYIQEIPWNNSCAGSLVTSFLGPLGIGLTTALTPVDFCNTSLASEDGLVNAAGGSGGPSACATGLPATTRVANGTCAGYAKPSWQSGLFGNPSDGVRDIPDVALFASNGFWDAYYVVCWSDPDTSPSVGGGFTCQGAPSTWAGFGGTSVSAPIMAGIQALVNQHTGSSWGNPNTVLYALANAQFGADGSGAAACNSNSVSKTGNGCIFYDVTQGDNDGACRKDGSFTFNCYIPSGDTYGVLSTTNTSGAPAYPAGAGWDFTTGIGSVNAYNLVMGWP